MNRNRSHRNRTDGDRSWQEEDSIPNRGERLYPIGCAGLALEGPGSMQRAGLARRQPSVRRHKEFGQGAAAALRYLVAPWLAPVRTRYEVGNRPLMRLLDWLTAKTWVLAFMDDLATWFRQGSPGSRILAGSVTASAVAALLTVQLAALYHLQSITWQPVFGGHGLMILVAASFVLGATLVPPILGHVLPVLLRLYVLANLGAFAALLGYGVWLLCSGVRS